MAGKVAGGLILLWTNLVLTGQFLSLFSAMNSVPLFLGVSLLLAAAVWALIRWLGVSGEPVLATAAPVASGLPYERLLLAFFLLTGAAALVLNLLIAVTHLASNPDTVVYRFPRAYWYLTHGALSHFSAGTDPRLIFYPSNGVMLYVPLVLYRFGALWFNLPTLLAWCAIPAICYAFARDLGAARLWAVAAGWTIALTPNVLIQALSTNDEILAAASLLAGLYFLHRWYLAARLTDLLIGFLGIALSVGTKLHAFFYWPYLLILAIAALTGWRRCLALAKPLLSLRGASTLAVCGLAGVAMVVSFMIYNWRATGQITEYGFAKLVLNTPFNPAVSAQTILVYASQIMLSPFPDLLPNAGYSGDRIPHYAAFNAIWAPLFTWVENGPAYTSVGYRYTGVVSNLAFLLNEQTVMLGFSWLTLLVSLIWLATHRGSASRWAIWVGLSFPAWFLCWAASTKYIEGIPVYVAYAAIISSPAWAFAMAPVASTTGSKLRWAVLGFVSVTHLLTAVTVFGLNTSRSASAALSGKFKLPRSVAFTVDPSVTDELAHARAGLTHHTIDWGQPNWVFMAFNPAIPQKLQSNSGSYPGDSLADPEERLLANSREMRMPRQGDPTLHVYPIRQFPAFGHAAVKVGGKTSPGLTLIGELRFALGPEWVFAAGNEVEKRHPGASGYLVFTFNEVSDFGHNPKPVLDVSANLLGLNRDDDLSFRHVLTIDGKIADQTDWARTPAAKLSTTGLGPGNGVLTIQVRNNKAGGRIDTVDVRLRSTTPPVLAR
jgi:hypothetical protein